MSDPNVSASAIWNQGDYQRIAGEHQIVSERLCHDLQISAGMKVLDVACGTGNTAMAAARRRANVVGIDIASTLLDRARRRAAADALDDIRFDEGDAAAMPYPDASFDVVLSTFGAVFVPDQVRVASEMMRVLRPGGQLGVVSYTAESLPGDMYRLGASLAKPPEGASRPAFDWAGGGRVAELLGDQSAHIRVALDSYDACFVSAQAFVDHLEAWYGPIVTRLSRMTAEQGSVYRAGMAHIARRHNRATDGSFCVSYGYAQITALKRMS